MKRYHVWADCEKDSEWSSDAAAHARARNLERTACHVSVLELEQPDALPVELNGLDTYSDAGAKEGAARRRGDHALARHWADWTRKALSLEAEPYRDTARMVYRDAYTQHARP